MSKKYIKLVLSLIFLFFSYLILRINLVYEVNLDFKNAIQVGLFSGLISDLAFCFLSISLVIIFILFSNKTIAKCSLSLVFLIWFASLANLTYFKFFRQQLELWMITSYGENLWSIRGLIQKYISDLWVFTSIIFLGLSFYFLISYINKMNFEIIKKLLFVKKIGISISLVILSLLVRQSQVWLQLPYNPKNIIHNQVIYKWIQDIKKYKMNAFLKKNSYKSYYLTAFQKLNEFSQKSSENFFSDLTSNQKTLLQSDTLQYDFIPDDKITQNLKEQFGFKSNSRLNVIILFLETGRAFEFLHPEYSHVVYPQLNKIFSKYGWLYSQTYSSSLITVGGQFAVLCSGIDRFDGPTPYSSQPYFKVKCLPDYFKENDYQTIWMNPYVKYFEGKYSFESSHGMQEFYDRDFFQPTNEIERKMDTEWGVMDEVFYSKSFEQLMKVSQNKKPFFAHLLNTGTHGPWERKFTDVTLNSLLEEKNKLNPSYISFLKTLKQLDSAVSKFIDSIFQSEIGDETLIVVVGDHGSHIKPTYPELNSLQIKHLQPRVIMGFLSKNIKQPQVITSAVSQIDVAPTIGHFVGFRSKVTWLGRKIEPNKSEGSFWLSHHGQKLSYRTQNMFCTESHESNNMSCWKIDKNKDPLIDQDIAETLENKFYSDFFKKVVNANEALMESGHY